MVSKTEISERRACSLVDINRVTLRYQSTSPEEVEMTLRIKAIAFERRRFGYRRVHQMLRREGVNVNHKKVYRLYGDAGLVVRKRKRRKGIMVAPHHQKSKPQCCKVSGLFCASNNHTSHQSIFVIAIYI